VDSSLPIAELAPMVLLVTSLALMVIAFTHLARS
jgi:hypothetical protein